MAGPINLKQQKSSFTATVIFSVLNYDLFRLQILFFLKTFANHKSAAYSIGCSKYCNESIMEC